MNGTGVHACALIVGECGVLIRGPSGAGKSLLSLAMIGEARRAGRFGALVADDRVFLAAVRGRLLASCARGFEGLIERRGEGLLRAPHEPRAMIRLVVDIVARGVAPPRWPEHEDSNVRVLDIPLPRLWLDLAPGLQEGAYAALRRVDRVT